MVPRKKENFSVLYSELTYSNLDVVRSDRITGHRVRHVVLVVVQVTVGSTAFQFDLDDVQESSRVGIHVHVFDMPIDVFGQLSLQCVTSGRSPDQNGCNHLEQNAEHRDDAVLEEKIELVWSLNEVGMLSSI